MHVKQQPHTHEVLRRMPYWESLNMNWPYVQTASSVGAGGSSNRASGSGASGSGASGSGASGSGASGSGASGSGASGSGEGSADDEAGIWKHKMNTCFGCGSGGVVMRGFMFVVHKDKVRAGVSQEVTLFKYFCAKCIAGAKGTA